MTPDSGKRFCAAQFLLTNTGTVAYSDSPSNGAQVTDSQGQTYTSIYSDMTECQSFPGSEKIAPGSFGLGCISFQVPAGAKIVKVQFALNSGMGPDTGQWNV